MELRYYLRIIRRWWWLAAVPFVAIVSLSFVVSQGETAAYQSTATFVIRPRLLEGEDAVRATDFLVRSAEIPPTLAQIAQSSTVRQRAEGRLEQLSDGRHEILDVESHVVAGTTILSISARGLDAELTRTYVGLLAEEAVAYVESVGYIYTLSALDEPSLAGGPVGTGRILTIAGGGMLGLLVGALSAFSAHHLQEPRHRARTFDIIDPLTGLHNEEFFSLRFEQELSRSQRTGASFTVAMIQVDAAREYGLHAAAHGKDVQLVAALLALCARPEDVLGYVGDATIMMLLPTTDQEEAEELALGWRRSLWPETDGRPPPFSPFGVRIGLCQYGPPSFQGQHDRLPARV